MILSCSFVGNETNNAGGGTYFHNRCHAILRSVTIEDNISGGDGGALHSTNQSNLTIESSIIKNNNTNGGVGGLYIQMRIHLLFQVRNWNITKEMLFLLLGVKTTVFPI